MLKYTCKEYAEVMKRQLYQDIRILDRKPKLVVIQIGDNPSSNSYIKGKQKDCEEVGILFELKKYESITNDELRNVIVNLNLDDTVDGIILQLPVPVDINIKEIQMLIDPYKDVDGFNKLSDFKPCTPKGIIDYLNYNNFEFDGRNAVVIGRSDTVGKPLAEMLLDKNCNVTVCHSHTSVSNINDHVMNADIVFTCIDKIEYFNYKNLYDLEFVPYIIDIGLGLGEDNKLHGNIHHDYIEYLKENDKRKFIISGTGGVGLLTRLALLENTYEAYMKNENIIWGCCNGCL